MRVAYHLGLGDAIICAPIIAKLAESEEEIIIPAWSHNVVSVESFFSEFPNVKVRAVHFDEDFLNYEYKLGRYSDIKMQEGESFIEWFYRQAGMSNFDRLKYCPLNKAYLSVDQRVNPYTVHDYIFIHQDIERGFIIDINKINKDSLPIKIWAENDGKSILSHSDIIRNAKEVHCIDSSFLHLAEALPTIGKLFYHQYARPNSTDNFKFIKDWEVIK